MTSTTHELCILLGSNISPETHLPQAIAQLGQRLTIARISNIWESEAVGSDGPNFLNAALLVYSQLHPEQLKNDLLRPLEAQMGRIRTENKNAPRPIDLDVVVFNRRAIDPHLWKYAHLAVPIAELLPELSHPVNKTRLKDAARQLRQKTTIIRRSDPTLPTFFNKRTPDSALLMTNPGIYQV